MKIKLWIFTMCILASLLAEQLASAEDLPPSYTNISPPQPAYVSPQPPIPTPASSVPTYQVGGIILSPVTPNPTNPGNNITVSPGTPGSSGSPLDGTGATVTIPQQ